MTRPLGQVLDQIDDLIDEARDSPNTLPDSEVVKAERARCAFLVLRRAAVWRKGAAIAGGLGQSHVEQERRNIAAELEGAARDIDPDAQPLECLRSNSGFADSFDAEVSEVA